MKAINIKVLIILFLLTSCASVRTKKDTNLNSKVNSKTKDTVPQIKNDELISYGFKFSIPKNWHTIEKNVQSIDLNGKIISSSYKFSNVNKTFSVSIVAHPGKNGIELFNYYKTNPVNTSQKEITIDNRLAIRISKVLKKDGKGHTIVAQRRDKILVLSSNNKACIEIVIDAKKGDQNSFNDFNKFINSVKILQKN